MKDSSHRIVEIRLDERTVLRRNPDVEHERAVAIFDLLEENFFQPIGDYSGPYKVRLGIEENRLVFGVDANDDTPLTKIALPLASFRSLVRDYFTICESYFAAIKKSSPSQIEAIDMGRRAIHNDGAEQLRERLAGTIALDLNTARRLFTLICVLHIRGT